MTALPDELIEQIRDAADVVELIGSHVDLKRTGSDYRGPCPFHGGTHRNLTVIPKKQMYYCFVCHESGDVFSFLMKKIGMDYPTAVREVARQVGIVIPERSTGGPDPREPLYSAVTVAAEWYARRLWEAPDAGVAREYLQGRGLTAEMAQPLGLGFAPRGTAFLDSMRTLGFTEERLLEAGLLVKREDGSLRPRFWGRLLFPIHDLRGRVVGFGGRVLDDGEPKYLNSPDSPIFHKGKLLYNLHHAKHAIRKAEQAIVVEGYFEMLRLVESGIDHVVAPLGTALTSDQSQLLRRFTPNVTLLYDSDAAGLRATFRAGDELLRASVRVTVATMPPGEDPDTLAAKGGAAAVRGVLADAIDVCERKLQLLDRKGWLGSLAGRRRALDRLLPTLRAAADPVTRDLYLTRVAETLGVSVASVAREMETARASGWKPAAHRPEPRPTGRPEPRRGMAPTRGRPERDLLRVMIHAPEWRSRIAEQLRGRDGLREPEAALLARLADSAPATPVGEVIAQVDGEARMVMAELLAEGWGSLDIDAIVAGALGKLDSRRLEAELRDLERRLPLASDDEKPGLARTVDSLSRQIAKLNPGRWNVILKGRSSAR